MVMNGTGSGDGRGDRPRCGAALRQSEGTCKKPPGWGTSHVGSGRCRLHGGNTRTQTVAAERQIAERRARQLLGELGQVAPVTDPAGELQLLAGEIVGMKNAAAALVAGLDEPRYRGANGTEQLRAEIVVYERSLDRAARVLGDMVKLGLEERQVRLAEEHGALIAQAIRAILADLQLTPEQQARVSEVVPRHLRALVAAEAAG